MKYQAQYQQQDTAFLYQNCIIWQKMSRSICRPLKKISCPVLNSTFYF